MGGSYLGLLGKIAAAEAPELGPSCVCAPQARPRAVGDAVDECGGVPKVAQNGQNREFGRQILRTTIKFCASTNSIFRFGIIKCVYGASFRALGLRIDSGRKLEQINSETTELS